MVMTPVHMGAGTAAPTGTTLRVIGLVISVHVAGMYLFSPVVGWLADRAGRPDDGGASGGVLLLAATVLAGTAPPGRGRSSSAPGCSCSGWAGRAA